MCKDEYVEFMIKCLEENDNDSNKCLFKWKMHKNEELVRSMMIKMIKNEL